MTTKELCSIREWSPLAVIERLPAKLSRLGGLFPVDINLTCVSAIDNFIALGSDAGVVFWYNRHTGDVQKLRAEVASRITCVQIVNSVEYMVAAGSSTGQVSVFQIQKELPPDLNLPCVRVKPIQRYTIRDLHNSSVSCCEWSRNGMKLFTGDRQGVVVLTEFDYLNHLSKSVEIICEDYEIVQLSLHQSHLLVSTLYRSIVCQRSQSTGQWRVLQVGKKDRKQLTDCGGIFLKRNGASANTNKPQLICGRPGLRFWLADADGNVEKTLLFRQAVANSPTWEIPILNPKNSNLNSNPHAMQGNSWTTTDNAAATSTIGDSHNFHELQLYAGQDSLVVTHDDSALYILNLDRLRVEAAARGFRKILDFCVCDREIFVLEGKRSLLRLAPMPEKPNKTAKIIFNPNMPPPVPPMGAIACGKHESPVEYEPEGGSILRAEECFELQPIEALDLNIPIELAVESPRAEQNRRLEIFNKISTIDFDKPILHHSGISAGERKKRRKSREHQKSQGIVEIGHLALPNDVEPQPLQPPPTDTVYNNEAASQKQHLNNTSERQTQAPEKSQPKLLGPASTTSTTTTTKPTAMEASFCTAITSTSTTHDGFVNPSPLPDLITPNTLRQCFEQNTLSLAEELSLAMPQHRQLPLTLQPDLHESIYTRNQPMRTTPPPPPPPPTTPASTSAAAQVYPKQPLLEDAAVQTTPKRKFYVNPLDECDYSDGQPVDDICATLQAAKLLVQNSIFDEPASNEEMAPSLRFVSTQPTINDEIGSFLLDFSRAADPLRARNTPPPSGESNTSSEWEFLDN